MKEKLDLKKDYFEKLSKTYIDLEDQHLYDEENREKLQKSKITDTCE